MCRLKPRGHPPRPAGEPGADATELCLPVEAAEGLRNRLALGGCGSATASEVLEVQFVQHHRAGANEMLALQVVVDVGRHVLVASRLREPRLDNSALPSFANRSTFAKNRISSAATGERASAPIASIAIRNDGHLCALGVNIYPAGYSRNTRLWFTLANTGRSRSWMRR